MVYDANPLPGYPEPYGLLGAILQDGTREWRAELDPDLPAEAIAWQPHPETHSIGAVILHIIGVEVSWIERFALGLPADPDETKLFMDEEIDQDSWVWPIPPGEPLSWYFELHDRIRSRTLENLKRLPPADEVRKSQSGGCTYRWIIGHVIQHESYHGGQAVLLSRLWQLRSG
jgi:uncharacterized damage-inducible protein DinB